MRRAWLNVPIVLISIAATSAAFAGGKTKGKKESDTTEAAAGGPKKDPKGQTGISPFMERVNEGAAAYVAGDYAKAIELFRKAIEQDPDKALGHYLLGEAYLADKKLEEAERAWQAALQHADKDIRTKAKVLFALADLRERQGRLADAATAWKEYESFVNANAGAGYPATAADRQRAIAAHDDLAQKYAKVKERIEQRQREVSEQKK
jgi:tetratricopeptide (TPR) repeat protein